MHTEIQQNTGDAKRHPEAEKVDEIEQEFLSGFAIKDKYPRTITLYGSSRFQPDNTYSKHAEALSGRIARELQYTIVSGGGHGIMEAVSKGGKEAGGTTLGFNIKLPHEQTLNNFLTEHIEFKHFFARKVLLSYMADAYIFYPGGYGTLDEFFETLTLIQTGKAPRVPVILVGTEFWAPLADFFKKVLLENYKTIDEKDLDIFHITDDAEEIISLLRK